MARRANCQQTNHVILVVDDQEETLISLRHLLEREGHRVLTASSGDEALRIAKDAELHLIIVDYVMPRMTGRELVSQIRQFDPFVQIILQTGYAGDRPPRVMLAELDIQGYHDKADGPDRLLLWVDVSLKAYRLLQAVREREQLQSDLVANCSHEFRTPLNIIQGYASLLVSDDLGQLPQFARGPVESIVKATAGLTDLITDFLKYAKIDAGVTDVHRDWIETADLVREMQTLGAALVDEKPVTFHVEVDGPAGFAGDDVKVRTVLRNLVGNAAKFTAEGSITLRMRFTPGGLSFTVTDTGPGIRPDDHEIVFEAFRQVDGSSTRKHGGVGLGLALSRRLARVMGGDLTLVSVPGHGASFTLQLPVPDVAERDVTGAAAH
jgi:signal transduction histidine kinase